MPWVKIPIQEQWTDANDVNASGYVVKCYLPGTTTATPMAIDSAGATTVTTATLNADGFAEVSGNEVALYIDRDFKIAIYENASDAAANTNAYWGPVDNIKINSLTSDFQSDYWVDSLANLRAKTSSEYTDGDVIKLTDTLVSDDFVVKTGTVTQIVGIREPFTDDSNRYAEREYNGLPDINWAYSGDIGADINAWTAAGILKIRVPEGSYTQSTTLTQNQEVHLIGDYWDEFGTPPATIAKDADIRHIKTNTSFTSLGIKWDGGNIAGGTDGIELNGKFHFIGQVVDQTGNGLVLKEESGDNLNNSILGGAFSGNDIAQLVIENTDVTGSNNIDINTILFKYIRCNSGRIGLHVKGGLFNEFQYINTKGNTEIGVFCEAINVIERNTFRIYSENSAGGVLDFFAIDGWTAFGGAPTQTGATTFTLTGDQTATFVAGGKIRMTDNGVEYYGTIDSAVFSSVTTVTVTVAGNVALTSNLTAVATDAAANYFRDNEFIQARGLVADDIYIGNGNILRNARATFGIFTNSEQPWVKVHLGGDETNVTGNGTTWTATFDTEIKDTQGDFDTSTYTYTAPTTGRYKFNGSVRLQGLSGGSHTRCELNLVTSNRTYNLIDTNLDNVKSSSNIACLGFDTSADMDSSDTATLTLEVTGAGVDDVDVSGGAGQTWMDIVFEG